MITFDDEEGTGERHGSAATGNWSSGVHVTIYRDGDEVGFIDGFRPDYFVNVGTVVDHQILSQHRTYSAARRFAAKWFKDNAE